MYSDKYCPMTIDDLSSNNTLNNTLNKLDLSNNILFYGAAGCGKKTRALCVLSKLYNQHEFLPKINKSILSKGTEFIYKSTNYHIEVCPSDYGSNDKTILNEFVYSLAESPNILANNYRIFIIEKVDNLSVAALNILKNIMEKTMRTSRFILLARNINCVPDVLKNFCICIRIKSPCKSEVIEILSTIADNESLDKKSIPSFIKTHTEPYDLKRIINQFQLCYIDGKYKFFEESDENKLNKICLLIKNNFDFAKIPVIRKLIYELYISCIDTTYIIKYIVKYFIGFVKNPVKLTQCAAENQYYIINTNKDIIYIEAVIYEILSQLY